MATPTWNASERLHVCAQRYVVYVPGIDDGTRVYEVTTWV
jgi:hypothetical protein